MTPDIIAIKAAVLAAMTTGIDMVPPRTRVTFRQMVRKRLAGAQHLGTMTFDEIEASDLLGEGILDLPPHQWPVGDVTYLLVDDTTVNLVWLHALAPGKRQPIATG